MSRFIVPIVAFLALIAVLTIGLTRDPGKLESTYIDKQAPAFDLPSLTDAARRVNNDRMEGSMALVNVWATWCVGCREEHPFLMRLAADNPLPIYGINWRDDKSTALDWLDRYGDPYVDSGFDADGRVGIDWGVYGAPETFLLDANGVVVYKHLGPLNAAIWERDFVPLLAAGGSKQ